MTEGTRRAFGLDDSYLLKWRAGGRSDRARTLLFVAGVSIMMLVGFKMLSGAALPQRGGPRRRGPMGPNQELARLSKRLHLTAAQKAQIKPILREQRREMMALRQKASLSREDRMAKFRAIHQRTADKIRSVLTPAQQKRFQRMQRARLRRFRGRPPK